MGSGEQELTRANKKENKRSKTKLILTIIFVALILLIGTLFYFSKNLFSEESQIKDFKRGVVNKDYNEVKSYLDNNSHKVTEEEAKNFINYIHEKRGIENFERDINNITKNLDKKNQSSNLGVIYGEKNQKIININKNGKRFLLFDKVSFSPVYHKVYIQDINNSEYQFKNNGKETTVKTEPKNLTSIGNFIAGDYNIKAKKKINGETIYGQLNINTVNNKKEKIAKQDFNQTTLKAHIENEDILKDKNLYLNINGDNYKYSNNKTYGYFSLEKPIKIYGTAKIGEKKMKTNVEYVQDKDRNIDLAFKSNEINEYLKEEKEKKKASDFMSDYVEALNSAYESKEFGIVSKYFVADSKASNHIKKMVNGNNKFKYESPKVVAFKKEKSYISVDLIKKDNNGNSVKSRYKLKHDNKKDNFKIKEYKDI